MVRYSVSGWRVSAMNGDPLRSSDIPKPVVIGTGLVALDVVFGPDGGEAIGRWAGGTCGNVLTILSSLGWSSFPVARLAGDEPAQALCQDLASWGVRLDYVSDSPQGSTPVILQYLRRDERGDISHKFSMRCPVCGHHLPGFRPVPSHNIRQILDEMPRPEVFFFDRCSRGAIDLAAASRDSGAIVVFEPSGRGEPALFEESLELAHVVKYSRERWAGREIGRPNERTWLVVETLGKDGLRFASHLPAFRTNGWIHLPAMPVEELKDAAGSGDWCTAGLIACLGKAGAEGLANSGEHDIRSAFGRAQALANWNCGFQGARGGMYNLQRDKLAEVFRGVLPLHHDIPMATRRSPQIRGARATRSSSSCCEGRRGVF